MLTIREIEKSLRNNEYNEKIEHDLLQRDTTGRLTSRILLNFQSRLYNEEKVVKKFLQQVKKTDYISGKVLNICKKYAKESWIRHPQAFETETGVKFLANMEFFETLQYVRYSYSYEDEYINPAIKNAFVELVKADKLCPFLKANIYVTLLLTDKFDKLEEVRRQFPLLSDIDNINDIDGYYRNISNDIVMSIYVAQKNKLKKFYLDDRLWITRDSLIEPEETYRSIWSLYEVSDKVSIFDKAMLRDRDLWVIYNFDKLVENKEFQFIAANISYRCKSSNHIIASSGVPELLDNIPPSYFFTVLPYFRDKSDLVADFYEKYSSLKVVLYYTNENLYHMLNG